MGKHIKTILKFCLFLGIGFVLVWWSVKDLSAIDKKHIREAVTGARYWLAIPGFLIILLSHYARALRWRLLIEPLGYKPAKPNVFFAVMAGYLANQAVPRLGEVLKCTSLSKYEKIPLDKLFGTVILERLIDMLCLGILFLFTMALQPDLYSRIMETFFQKGESATGQNNIIFYGSIGFGICVAVILAWMIIAKKSIADVWRIIKNLLMRVWEGLTTIIHLKKRVQFTLLTIIIWLCYTLGGYIGFLALNETMGYGLKESLMVLCAGSIGMIATPGGIGAYPFMLQKTLQLYNLNPGTGLAYGWLMWIMQTSVILIVGLISVIAFPWYNRKRGNIIDGKPI